MSNRNQRTGQASGEVTEDGRLTRGYRDNPERGLLGRAVVSGQDSCKEDSLEKSTGKAEGREWLAETGANWKDQEKC